VHARSRLTHEFSLTKAKLISQNSFHLVGAVHSQFLGYRLSKATLSVGLEEVIQKYFLSSCFIA
jgi:hypothetical protein